MNTLELLESSDHERIQLLVNLLSRDGEGIVSDEDDGGLTSTMIENWTDDCEKFLRTQGYTGGEIRTCGKFFSEHGAIYALYNTSLIEFEEAYKYLESVSQRPI